MLQKYCRGYLVAKKYSLVVGNRSIHKKLSCFSELRREIELQFVRQLSFVWRVYKRTKAREAREADARKKKKSKKGKGKKKTGLKQRGVPSKTKSTKNTPKLKSDSLATDESPEEKKTQGNNLSKKQTDAAEDGEADATIEEMLESAE